MTVDIAMLLLLAFIAWQLLRIGERLDRQEALWRSLLRHLGVTPAQLAEPSDDVKALARQPGKYVEAIKAYRQETGAELKDAKAAIDRIVADGA